MLSRILQELSAKVITIFDLIGDVKLFSIDEAFSMTQIVLPHK